MPTLESHRKSWTPKRKKSNKSWASDPRYHTARWRNYRVWFLQITGISGKSGKLCVHCKAMDKITPANTVDHVIPLSQDSSDENFWNGPYQALCKPCNSRKSQTDRKK